MSDQSYQPPTWRISHDESRGSVPAIIAYWVLGIWTFIVVAFVVLLIGMALADRKMDSILLNIVFGIIGTTSSVLVAALGFWIGTTANSKKQAENQSENLKASMDAMAKIAGTGTGQGPAEPASAVEDLTKLTDAELESEIARLKEKGETGSGTPDEAGRYVALLAEQTRRSLSGASTR